MKLRNKILAAVVTLALCLTILCPMPVQAASVCFTAVNDRVLELTNEGMPVWSAGVLYAPATTFNQRDNGIVNWGIQTSYSRTNNTITVFDTRRFLVFDLRNGTCWDDLTGVAYSGGAIVRDGRPYLPVDIVCDHFDLSYSYREIEQGELLRIKSDEAVLSDNRFADAASNTLNLRLRDYNQSQGMGESTSAPAVTPEEPEQAYRVSAYLSFRCESADYLEAILSVLDTRNVNTMFFLTPELIVQRSDLVMQILGSGHSVGLLAQGETLEETRRILTEGNRVLGEQVFLRTTVALTLPEHRQALEEEGWICWKSTLDLTPGDNSGANYFTRRVLTQLDGRTGATYLALDADSNALRVLPTLLLRLAEEGFDLRVPLETRI